MQDPDTTQTGGLLASVAAGDKAALEKLVCLHSPYLRRIVQLRISPELSARLDASDVVQETQLVVMRRIGEFINTREVSFRVWLRSRAIEQLADQYRRHVGAAMRSVRREQNANDCSSMAIARALTSDTPSKLVQRREFSQRVRDLIESLNKNDREMLSLRHVDGLTNNEAAEVLRIEPMTARKRYGRAVRRFVERATESGLDIDLS